MKDYSGTIVLNPKTISDSYYMLLANYKFVS